MMHATYAAYTVYCQLKQKEHISMLVQRILSDR